MIRYGSAFLMICVLLAGLSCQKQQPLASIMPANADLRSGDVVFRRGGGIASRAVMTADHHGKYSHVGIVVDSCGVMMIVHAVPQEHRSDASEFVKMESPEHFYSSHRAVIGEICRHSDSALAKRAAAVAVEVYRRKVMFDHDYDETDTTKMYCTELVEYAFTRAGASLADDRRHNVSLPFLHATCILPSDIYASSHLASVKTF